MTPSGGTQPNNIVSAMLLIAQNPGNNVAAIYGQATATPPFQPTVSASAPPQDLTLAITYAGGGMTAPGDIVIDANNDAVISNSPSTAIPAASGTDSIVVFGPDGSILSGNGGYTAGIHGPGGVAIDSAGNIWSTDAGNGNTPDQVVKISSTGALAFAFSDSSISGPQGIAIDRNDSAWVVNQNTSYVDKINPSGVRTALVSTGSQTYPTGVGIDGTGNIFVSETGAGTIAEFNTAGTFISPAGGYSVSGLNQPLGISVDASGNVWTIDNISSGIVEITNNGTLIPRPGTQASLSNAYVLAIDGAGGAWYANCRAACGDNSGKPDNLTHVLANQIQSTGTADGYQDSHLSRVGTAAIDGGGSVWVSNNASGTVTEFIGVAPPVITPLSLASSANKLGTRP